LLSGCLLLSLAAAASAQYPYPYPYPGGGVYAPYAGPGGYLAGQAQVINAYGGFQQQQQEAQITNQKALQEQINTKKMELDWKQYEAAKTPTYTQVVEHEKQWKEYRILTNPTPGEIASGEALNILLPYLQNLSNKGVQGPPVAISPDILSRINVTGPLTTGNPGMLKDGANLKWPMVLKGPTQKKLADELNQAVSMAVNDSLDFKLYKQVRADFDKLMAEHKKKFHTEEIDGGTYLVGKRFLDDLETAIKVLEDPNATKFLGGTYKAKGHNVQELIQNMNQQGLQFAAALSGDEPAYISLHGSMTTYAVKAQTGSGFQVQLGPAGQQSFQKAPPKKEK
jgi:hypothetical protein